MRTTTAGEQTVLNSVHREVHSRVEIVNAVGAWTSLSSLSSFNWVVGWTISESVDQPVAEARVTLRRDQGDSLSLSPFRGDSSLNAAGALLDAGRGFRISTATVGIGVVPGASDWKLKFDGITDVVDFASEDIEIIARDWGAKLIDRWVEADTTYTYDPATPIETVAQDVLNQWAELEPVYTPVSPGFVVSSYPIDEQPVFDALRSLVSFIGWDIRYAWDDSSTSFRLKLYEPDRAKTVPDWTFAANRYFDVTQLRIDREPIRNVIDVSFKDATTGERGIATVEDSASVVRFGRRWMRIEEADDSVIDSEPEALDLALAAKSDLAWPLADQEISLPYFWPGEIGDLYRFSANGVHYNSNQDLAAVSLTHTFAEGEIETTQIRVRGKPAGFYLDWHNRGTVKRSEEELQFDLGLYDVKVVSQTNTSITWQASVGGRVYQVLVYDKLDYPITAEDHPTTSIPPDANRQITYTALLPGETHVRNLMLSPVGIRMRGGKPWLMTIHPKPDQAPVTAQDNYEDGEIGTLWFFMQERGIAITNVQVQTQIGTAPLSVLVAPARDAGDASIVKGGLLAANEYEHDVTLDSYRQAWIYAHITIATGEVYTIASPGFDPNRIPDFVTEPTVVGTSVTVNGDADTICFAVERMGGGTWQRIVDSWTGVVDVTTLDDDANAGLGSNTTATYRITLYSDPKEDIDANSLTETHEVQVTNGTSSEPTWDAVAALSPSIGSAIMTINLEASSAPGGYTARVWYRSQLGGLAFTDWTNITASLSPALSAPPTTLTAYTYTTAFQRIAKDLDEPIVTVEVRGEILNGSSVVVATQSESANWYSGEEL